PLSGTAVAGDSSKDWEKLKAEGNEHYKNMKWSEAADCYSQAIGINSKVAALYSNRALCQIQLAKFDLARQDAEDAIAIDPNQVKFYRTLSEALFNLKLFKEAVDACRNGLKIDSRDETLNVRARDCMALIIDREIKEHPFAGGFDQLKTKDASKNLADHVMKQGPVSPDDVGTMDSTNWQTASEIKKAHRILLAGRGTVRGEQKALKIFESAAKRGSAEGLYNMALMYKDGMAGLAVNPKKYLDLCRKAAEQKPYLKVKTIGTVLRNIGVAEAENAVAMAYRDGLAVDQDDKLAFNWFLKAAEHGCPSGMNNLGLALYNGMGCEMNLKSARSWYQKSADLGQSEALFNLAGMLVKGEGGPQDAFKAAQLLKTAADQGLPGALLALQHLQRSGAFGAASMNASTKVVRQMADSNEKQALFVIGMNYLMGEGGFTKDLIEAEKHLRKASALNHKEATFQFGRLLLQQRRNEDAAIYIRKAADSENEDAQRTYGHILAFGHGCERNVSQARRWLLRSKQPQSDVDELIKYSTAVIEFEAAEKLSKTGLTYFERIERYAESLVSSEEKQGVKDLLRIFKNSHENPPHPTRLYSDFNLSAVMPMMAKRVAQGSKTAQKFFVCLNLLDQADLALEINRISDAFRLYRQADRVWHPLPVDLEKLRRLFSAATQAFERNPRDADALYVIVHYNMALKLCSLAELLRMASMCTHLNPDVADYHNLVGHLHAFNGDYIASHRSIERALELEWEPDWLYSKASSLRLQDGVDREAVIKAYEEYISSSEPDNHNVPKAFYSLAESYSITDIEKAREYFEKGLRAESPEIRLPVFESLDDFPPKKLMKIILQDPLLSSSASSAKSSNCRCANCGKLDALQRCSKCKISYYCGRDCQVNHWKKHKKNCHA
ncbi:hypothetical protein BOX15_Mlig024716g1, partial [Macrostomum lignano]